MLLALGASIVWGYSTFVAGATARRASLFTFLFWSQAWALPPLAIATAIFDQTDQSSAETAAAFLAGAGACISFLFLYWSSRYAPIGIVAAVSAVFGIGTPVVYALVRGTAIDPLVIGGVGVSVAAIVTLVVTPERSRRSKTEAQGTTAAVPGRMSRMLGIVGAAASGLAICVYYIGMSRTAPTSHLRPVFDSRISSTILAGLMCVAARATFRPGHSITRPAFWTAITGAGGSVMYVIAAAGEVQPAAIALSNLAPAITVFLGWLLVGERILLSEIIGLVLATIGVGLVLVGQLD